MNEITSLNKIQFPNSLKILTNGAFYAGELEEVIFGNGLEELTYSALGNQKFSKIILPEGLKKVGYWALRGNNIEEITFSKNTEDIGGISGVSNYPNLKTIYNNTGKAYDWNAILGNTSSTPFITGTVKRSDNSIVNILSNDSDVTKVIEIVNSYINSATTKYNNLTQETVKTISDMTNDGLEKNGNYDGNSWIYFNYSETSNPKVNIKDYSIKINYNDVDYYANYDIANGNIQITTNVTLRDKPLIIAGTAKADGRKYYDSTWIKNNPIYFDPTADNGTCTEQDYNNNTNKLGKTGCMKWYAYSENADGTINIILDHNTTSTVAWVSKEDYYQNNEKDVSDNYIGTTPPTIPALATTLGITYPSNRVQGTDDYGNYGNWNKGPITLLKQLMDDTNPSGNTANRWKNSSMQRSSYGSYTNSNTVYKTGSETVHDNYTINYSEKGYNARLITAQEVAYITNLSFDEKTSTSSVNFNSTTYAWLLENLRTSSNRSLPDGYWTASPSAGSSSNAWGVDYYSFDSNNYGNLSVNSSSYLGVRPVITVLNSILTQ